MAFEAWSSLRHRDFALLVTARVGSQLGSQMQTVAIGWFIYDVTRDPFALGFVGLAGFLPALSLLIATGYIADRFDRRLILVSASLMMTLAAAGQLAHVSSGIPIVWPMYLIIVFYGTARAFFQPAANALLPNLVPAEDFANAIAFSSAASQAATICGPALGGLLYSLDPRLPFAAAALVYAIAAAANMAMRPRAVAAPNAVTTWRHLFAGYSFAWSRPVVIGAITLDMFAVLLGGAVALLPIYAKDILEVGPWGLGLLRTAPAVGGIAVGLVIANRTFVKRHAGKRLFQAVVAFGLATIGFGLATNLYLSLLFLALVGAADMVSVIIRQTLVQADTPNDLRGRVAAFNSLFVSCSNEIGQFRSGVLAGFVGPVLSVVIGGAGAILVAGLWARWFPALRTRDHLVPAERQAQT